MELGLPGQIEQECAVTLHTCISATDNELTNLAIGPLYLQAEFEAI